MAGPGPGDEWRTVVLHDVPLALYERVRRHTDDLLREAILMAATAERGELTAETIRLAGVIAPIRAEISAQAQAATKRGDTVVTFRLSMPVAAAPDVEAWGRTLRGLAGLSEQGVMLTVPPTPEMVAVRDWYVGEMLAQLRRTREPRPWRPAATG